MAKPAVSSQTGPAQGLPQTIQVVEVSIEPARAPRDQNELIAGEPVRIGMRILGGKPPYRIAVKVVGQGNFAGHPAPLDDSFELGPQDDSAQGIETAVAGQLNAGALSGVYRLIVTLADAAGSTGRGQSGDVRIIGADAPLMPQSPGGIDPAVEVADIAGRQRQSFIRGEQVTVRARLPKAKTKIATADMVILAPDGAPLAHTRSLPVGESGEVLVPLDIPRLLAPGTYGLAFRAGSGELATGALRVVGEPFPPAASVTVDRFAIYGGNDGRAVRTSTLRRGEKVTIEARVGGIRKRAALALRLHGRRGVVAEAELGQAEPLAIPGSGQAMSRPAPGGRVYILGTWRVPDNLGPGPYQLEVEATEEQHVSTRIRQVILE